MIEWHSTTISANVSIESGRPISIDFDLDTKLMTPPISLGDLYFILYQTHTHRHRVRVRECGIWNDHILNASL